MDKQFYEELENASTIMLAPPNLVTNDQRREAEAVFLNFRKTKSPYNICRELLEKSPNDYVKFEAAEVLKTALIREWTLLDENDIVLLRDYLLHYVCNHTLAPYVQERILQVIAIMVKRASVEDFGIERANILNEVENLIMNADTSKQILATKIILNLMQEYAVTVKSTDVGLPLEIHNIAKVNFESNDLRRVLRLCLNVLAEVMKGDPPFAPNVEMLLLHILRIAEAVLTWSKCYNGYGGRKLGLARCGDSERAASLVLGSAWRVIVLAPMTVPLMFQVYWKVRDNDALHAYAMTCLVQLASLNGPIFANNKSLEYLGVYMENFLKFVSSVTVRSSEAVGIASIILNFRLYYAKDLMRLPEPLQASYFDEITRLTCCFIEGSTTEESDPNSNFGIALDTSFETWMFMVDDDGGQSEMLKQSAVRIFNTYLEFHLAAPDGRRQTNNEDDDGDENDRVKFKDNLQSIGVLGRVVLQYSLPLLNKLLEDRCTKLYSMLRGMAVNQASVVDLFEDIHWLVLIIGHTLCMDSDGEVPLVPSEVMRYSIDRCRQGHANLPATLTALATIQHANAAQLDVLQKCDDAMRAFVNVMRVCTLERQALENNMSQCMSPELGCTLMWFLRRWCLSYLLPTETYYDELSPTLIGALGKDTEGGTFVCNYLLEKIQSNLYYCKEETVLLADTVKAFTDIVIAKDTTYIVKLEGLWNLIKLQATIPPGILPANIRRNFYEGFVLVGSNLTNATEVADYYKQVLKPVEQRLKQILCLENFNRIYHEEPIKAELLDIVEKLIGICKGSTSGNVEVIFEFLAPILSELPVLLGIYHNYKLVVQMIIGLFAQCAKHTLCHLETAQSQRLYEYTYSAIQTYSKFNQNRFTNDVSEEEDSLDDLYVLMELLSFILCKDWLGVFCREDDTNALKGSDVALYGLRFLMPVMSMDLLKYPKLCQQYYRFLVLLTDMCPDRVVGMDDDMLANVLMSVHVALEKFSADIAMLCLDFLETLSSHIYAGHYNNTKAYQMMLPFLKQVIDMTLTQPIDSELLPTASTTIFALIMLYPDHYQMLVQSFIHSQNDDRIAARLALEFNKLVTDRGTQPTNAEKRKFRERFEKFIASVHGFLLIK